jgi:hypothetical protein
VLQSVTAMNTTAWETEHRAVAYLQRDILILSLIGLEHVLNDLSIHTGRKVCS